jgi:hypothetical protein
MAMLSGSTVGAHAQTVAPFPQVPLGQPAPRSHAWAYVSIAVGVGMVGSSFLIADLADDTYEDYLSATEPQRIEELYDRTLRLDAFSRAALLGGEALIGTGLYLRFVRRPHRAPIGLSLAPHRCAITVLF